MPNPNLVSILLPQLPVETLKDDYDNIVAIFTAIQQLQDGVTSNITNAGIGAVFTAMLPAAVAINAGTFVKMASDGRLVPADYTGVLGYVPTAVEADELTQVIFEGVVTNQAWNLVAGDLYYVDGSGNPIPASGRTAAYTDYFVPPAFLDLNVFVSLRFAIGFALTNKSILLCPKILSAGQFVPGA